MAPAAPACPSIGGACLGDLVCAPTHSQHVQLRTSVRATQRGGNAKTCTVSERRALPWTPPGDQRALPGGSPLEGYRARYGAGPENGTGTGRSMRCGQDDGKAGHRRLAACSCIRRRGPAQDLWLRGASMLPLVMHGAGVFMITTVASVSRPSEEMVRRRTCTCCICCTE